MWTGLVGRIGAIGIMIVHLIALAASFVAGYAFRWLHAEHLRNRDRHR